MRKNLVVIGFLAWFLVLQGVVVPSHAAAETFLDITADAQFISYGDSTKPTLIFDNATGAAWKYNSSTKAFQVYAVQAPAYPNSYIYSYGNGYLQKNGDIVFISVMQNPDYSRSHVYKNVFHAGVWGAWQLLRESDNMSPRIYVQGYTNYQGHDVLAFSTISGDYSSITSKIGTNLSGSWTELSYRTNNYDNLFPGSIIVPDQLDPNFERYNTYIVYKPGNNNEIDVRNGKMAFFVTAESDTSDYSVEGVTFNKKRQMYSQLVSLNPLVASTRRLVGSPQPYVETDVPTDWENSVEIDDLDFHWNAAGNDIVATIQTYTLNECWSTPVGSDENSFQKGHCTETAEIRQYQGNSTRLLASVTGTFGESVGVQFSEVLSSTGWVSTVATNRRDIERDIRGDYVKQLATGDWGWTMLKGDVNGMYTPRAITVSNSSTNSNRVWLNTFQGNPAAVLRLCVYQIDDTSTCEFKISYQGEGRSHTDSVPFVNFSTNMMWIQDEIVSTGSAWVAFTRGQDYSQQPSVSTARLKTNTYAPLVSKRTATMSGVASTVKKTKFAVLPVITKQGHPIVWAVASKSKKVCSLTISKLYGAVTKVMVKGIKIGTCTITAKASGGFFYKSLSKTFSIKVK